MIQALRRDLGPFFNYQENFWSFVIGAVSLGVFVNALFEFLRVLLTDWNVSLASLAVAGLSVAVFWLTVIVFSERMKTAAQMTLTTDMVPPRKRRGLIVLVSDRGDEVLRAAVEFHTGMLERCWLICSEKSKKVAEDFRASHPSICVDEPIVVPNVYLPIETFRAVRGILDSLGNDWNTDDVIADYTGMTAHASVGTALACSINGIAMQYTPPKTFDNQDRPHYLTDGNAAGLQREAQRAPEREGGVGIGGNQLHCHRPQRRQTSPNPSRRSLAISPISPRFSFARSPASPCTHVPATAASSVDRP